MESVRGESEQVERLRVAPWGRITEASRRVDIFAELARLRSGMRPGRDAYRQATLFHCCPLVHVLYALSEGGSVSRHAAEGMVTLHVLDGRLVVEVAGRDHELRAGQMLILDPDVAHSMHAVEASGMLLTVYLKDAA
jgi:mannose-6-phosphate isomerase-like protein (cupin superfamily)